MPVQSVLFTKVKWPKEKAVQWLKAHSYKHYTYRSTKNEIRFRQYAPRKSAQYYARKLPGGITLVIEK